MRLRIAALTCGSLLVVLALVVAQQPAARVQVNEIEIEVSPEVKDLKVRVPVREEDQVVASTPGQIPTKPTVDLPRGPFDLTKEHKEENNEFLQRLLADFLDPTDIVKTKTSTFKIELLAKRSDLNQDFEMTIFPRFKDDKPVSSSNPKNPFRQQIRKADIVSVTHWEQSILNRIKEILANPIKTGVQVGRFRELRVAEMVATETLKKHMEFRKDKGEERRKRLAVQGDQSEKDWDAVVAEYPELPLRCQIEELHALVTERNWNLALVLVDRFYNEDRTGNPAIRQAIERYYVVQAEDAIDRKDVITARAYLAALGKRYRLESTPEARRIRERLYERARLLVEEAQQLMKIEQFVSAIRKIELAEETWPELPRLKETRAEIQTTYPMLFVAVRELPTKFWPTTAESDVDRMACALIFENLVRLRSGPSALEGYVSPLGAELRVSRGNWNFILPPRLLWSNGQPVTANDIRRSFEIFGDPRSPLYHPLAEPQNNLIQVLVRGKDEIEASFQRAYFDPPSLLMFPILPADKFPPERSPRNPTSGIPVSTGPYYYAATQDHEVIFLANPEFRRPESPQGPRIKEVRFILYPSFEECRKALELGKVHMIVDVTTRERLQLNRADIYNLVSPTKMSSELSVVSNPRIYFLALNHHRSYFRSPELRQLISMSIDRDRLLSSVLRPPGALDEFHQQLRGPFPGGCWANHPTHGTRSLFRADLARKMADSVKEKPASLRLVCPAEDADGFKLCNQMVEMVAGQGVILKLEQQPRSKILAEMTTPGSPPDFDLLYWYYDYPNESMSLAPFLDPTHNFMGYKPETDLDTPFRKLLSRSDFSEIRRLNHDLHEKFITRMPFIPLWQLDRHIAVHRTVRFDHIHPIAIFNDPARWSFDYLP